MSFVSTKGKYSDGKQQAVPPKREEHEKAKTPEQNGERAPRPKPETGKASVVKGLVKWVVIILLLDSLLLNMMTYVFPIVRHYGEGMTPTLTGTQFLLMHKTDKVEQGDIISFYYNNNVMVRRVIAGPGDSVDIDIFGNVYVNGTELEEGYVESPTRGQTDLVYPYTVPSDSYFVMGDKREISMDSRLQEIGCIPSDRIIGKAMLSVYPLGRIPR